MSTINETLKQKIDELDLDRRLNDFVDTAEKALHRAVETVGDYAHEHRDDVDRVLDRVSATIEERTEGKYAEQVGKVRGHVDTGLSKLADRRPDPTDLDEDPTAPEDRTPESRTPGSQAPESREPDNAAPEGPAHS